MEQEQINVKEISKELKKMKERIEHLSSIIEDLDFAKETEKAWKEYDKGEYKKISSKEFLKEIDDIKKNA